MLLVAASFGKKIQHAGIVQSGSLGFQRELPVLTFLSQHFQPAQRFGNAIVLQRFCGLLVDSVQCRDVNHGLLDLLKEQAVGCYPTG